MHHVSFSFSLGTNDFAEATFIANSPLAQALHNSVPINAAIQLGEEHEFVPNKYWR
jgi:hypothetical protein